VKRLTTKKRMQKETTATFRFTRTVTRVVPPMNSMPRWGTRGSVGLVGEASGSRRLRT